MAWIFMSLLQTDSFAARAVDYFGLCPPLAGNFLKGGACKKRPCARAFIQRLHFLAPPHIARIRSLTAHVACPISVRGEKRPCTGSVTSRNPEKRLTRIHADALWPTGCGAFQQICRFQCMLSGFIGSSFPLSFRLPRLPDTPPLPLARLTGPYEETFSLFPFFLPCKILRFGDRLRNTGGAALSFDPAGEPAAGFFAAPVRRCLCWGRSALWRPRIPNILCG